MKQFMNRQRVQVVDSTSPLDGRTGAVIRLRHCDDGAWVRMDSDLPTECRVFTDSDTRVRDIVLYPEQCKPWKVGVSV